MKLAGVNLHVLIHSRSCKKVTVLHAGARSAAGFNCSSSVMACLAFCCSHFLQPLLWCLNFAGLLFACWHVFCILIPVCKQAAGQTRQLLVCLAACDLLASVCVCG
jgi:hypothetical protein